MQLDRLTLTRFRAFEQATFDFHPGMNLLVGINGVGKSTVLDALRVLLSRSLPKLIGFRSNPISLTIDDIAIGQDWLYAAIQFHVSEVQGIRLSMRYRNGEKNMALSTYKKVRFMNKSIIEMTLIELGIYSDPK